MTYKPLTECLACGRAGMEPYLDLGEQPLANSFHDGAADLPRYPLGLALCGNCWHSQLTVAVPPAQMFADYYYVSGTSEKGRAYFENFAAAVTRQRGAPGRVCDIGCNDGSQLDAFKRMGWDTYGVDPAENLHAKRAAGGHKTITAFFDRAAAAHLQAQYGDHKMDVITAQHVFAHTAEAEEFLLGCKPLMSPSSRLLIATSQATMFENNEFDTVYHEHVSFFCVNSMASLARRAGFALTDVEISDIHGNSYVFTLHLADAAPAESARLQTRRQTEAPRASRQFYARYSRSVEKTLADFNAAAARLRAEGRKLVGMGAAAKGMTFLNAANCRLDYILDKNPLKQGLFTPGQNIPIFPQEKIREENNAVALIPLAWNHYDEILGQILALAPHLDGVAVRYFPRLQIEELPNRSDA